MMFMVVLVGCIGAYYQRGAVASAAVISYMAGAPRNRAETPSSLAQRRNGSFKARGLRFCMFYPEMADIFTLASLLKLYNIQAWEPV